MQIVCNELYQHKYYLSKEEQLNSVDVDQISMDISCSEPIAKPACLETNSKAPKTSNDYEIYKYVLPSAKMDLTVKTFKLLEKKPVQVLNYLKRVLMKK